MSIHDSPTGLHYCTFGTFYWINYCKVIMNEDIFRKKSNFAGKYKFGILIFIEKNLNMFKKFYMNPFLEQPKKVCECQVSKILHLYGMCHYSNYFYYHKPAAMGKYLVYFLTNFHQLRVLCLKFLLIWELYAQDILQEGTVFFVSNPQFQSKY